LRRFYPYERGVPSHDTLNDLINAIDPDTFKACFMAWVAYTATACRHGFTFFDDSARIALPLPANPLNDFDP
jgi:hypothetical protein